MNPGLRPGELVEVFSAAEILSSLDKDGTLDGLLFMPEMLECCGKRFRVSERVVQATMDALAVPNYKGSFVREFKNNDVLLLEDLRCSGEYHGGCQRGCRNLWKEAWLEKAGGGEPGGTPSDVNTDQFKSKLKTLADSGRYVCQSSEFEKATNDLSSMKRLKKCLEVVLAGNCSVFGMLKRLSVRGYIRAREYLFGIFPRGNRKPTPVGILGLQAGEIVEVKSLNEIIETLDSKGCNRGLHFFVDMVPFCGKKLRVRSRTERLIAEMSGEMRGIPNTVILEGATHNGPTYAFGGCPRMEYQYWREIWLKRT